MENLIWVIVAIGVLVGALIMTFGFRKTDQKPVAFGRIDRPLKQDWMRTGNIDFHTSALKLISPAPQASGRGKESNGRCGGSGRRRVALAARNPGGR